MLSAPTEGKQNQAPGVIRRGHGEGHLLAPFPPTSLDSTASPHKDVCVCVSSKAPLLEEP